jgi:hypothetical protein
MTTVLEKKRIKYNTVTVASIPKMVKREFMGRKSTKTAQGVAFHILKPMSNNILI